LPNPEFGSTVRPGVIPHDARPGEQTANSGEKKIKKERQDFGKQNPKSNQEIEKEKQRLLKEQK
jgi:hypothetical protein